MFHSCDGLEIVGPSPAELEAVRDAERAVWNAWSKRLERLTAVMRRTRSWISLHDLLDWCSREADGRVDGQRQSQTCNDLIAGIKAGEFHRGERSRVLCLYPHPQGVWGSRAWGFLSPDEFAFPLSRRMRKIDLVLGAS